MRSHRPPPGPTVASGHVRVDAGRAIAKLRAYRLADPVQWVLEAIRAAVATGATRIDLDGDADDVWLRWAGPPWPAETLPALFDDLVSPEPAHGGYPRRLLANAINSGLGLDPAWIDVITVADAGATRVRFVPALLVPDADGVAPLSTIAPEPIAVPRGLGGARMVVHLRRRFGWSVVGRFLRGATVPELDLARASCGDLGVAMTIAGEPIGDAVEDRDLLRVPLGEGGDGFVALRAPGPPGQPVAAVVDFAELGVRIAREGWRPNGSEVGNVRLRVNADRMPTNASRSQVRRDAAPVASALRQAGELIDALVAQIADALTGPADERAREPLRAGALAMLGSVIGGPAWPQAALGLTGPLARLAALPLVRGATGTWRAVSADWQHLRYAGDDAQPAELAPWLDSLPWIPPGDAAEHLLGNAAGYRFDCEPTIATAHRRLAARTAFHRRPVQPAQVEGGASALLCVPLRESTDGDASLRGEVAVHAEPGAGVLVILLEGRLLATVPLPPPLAIDAVVDGARVVPRDDYDGVEHDDELRRVVARVQTAAVQAVGDGCASGGAQELPGHVVRAALAAAVALGLAIDDDHPLARAPVWPVLDGVPVALATLREQTAVAVTTPASRVHGPAGRPTVLVGAAERDVLSRLLGDLPLVGYHLGDNFGRRSPDTGAALARGLLDVHRTAALVLRGPGLGGAIAFAGSSSLALHHRGVALATLGRAPAWFDCAIAIDSEAIVPTADWAGVRDAGGAGEGLVEREVALARATVTALLGDPVPDLLVVAPLDNLDHPAAQALWRALAAGRPAELLGDALYARLRAHPVLRALGTTPPKTLPPLPPVPPPPPPAARRRAASATDSVGEALLDVVRNDPSQLLAQARLRTGLVALLAKGQAAPTLIETLRDAAAWPTLQGGRVALADVDFILGVPVARWDGPWLPATADDLDDAVDQPIIALPADEDAAAEWSALIDHLARWDSVDMTDDVARVQARRRRARTEPSGGDQPAQPATPAQPTRPAAPAQPADAIAPLVRAVAIRLGRRPEQAAAALRVTLVRGRREPAIAVSRGALELAGDAPTLVRVAALITANHAAAATAVDLVAAHLVTVAHLAPDLIDEPSLHRAFVELLS